MEFLKMNKKQTLRKPMSWEVLVLLCGLIYGVLYYCSLWIMDAEGVSTLSKTSAYWDFNNLWVGGRLVLEGHVDWIFNVDIYRPEMDRLLGIDGRDQEWSYPPSMLLIGVVLALMPSLLAYIVWTLGSLLLLHFAIRPLKLKPVFHFMALASPYVFVNAMFGQNGVFLSALLIAGLIQAPKRPILAGICFGIMTIKPHLGILIPFLLIASGNWRAFVSAGVTTIIIFAATGLFFGFDVWSNFLHYTQPLMQTVMEMPFYHPYQINSVTPFVFARGLGAGLLIAYAMQAVFSVAAIAVTIWLWRPVRNISSMHRLALTLVLVMIATPYGYTYDMVAIGVAMVIFMASSEKLLWKPVIAVIWLYPVYYNQIAIFAYANIGALIVVSLFILLFFSWRREQLNLSSPTLQPAE